MCTSFKINDTCYWALHCMCASSNNATQNDELILTLRDILCGLTGRRWSCTPCPRAAWLRPGWRSPRWWGGRWPRTGSPPGTGPGSPATASARSPSARQPPRRTSAAGAATNGTVLTVNTVNYFTLWRISWCLQNSLLCSCRGCRCRRTAACPLKLVSRGRRGRAGSCGAPPGRTCWRGSRGWRD